jgi:hypothetical protein
MCNKNDVLEIAKYQEEKHKGYGDESVNVLSYINSMPDKFEYCLFMCKLNDFLSCKLAVCVGKFIVPFKIRMKKYKQGKDWKII